MPSYRSSDAHRPETLPDPLTGRTGPDPEERRRQRERVIASLLACPGKGGRADGLGNTRH